MSPKSAEEIFSGGGRWAASGITANEFDSRFPKPNPPVETQDNILACECATETNRHDKCGLEAESEEQGGADQ